MAKIKVTLTVDDADAERLISAIERLAYALEREHDPEEGAVNENDTEAS